jgi:hypothetical protein
MRAEGHPFSDNYRKTCQEWKYRNLSSLEAFQMKPSHKIMKNREELTKIPNVYLKALLLKCWCCEWMDGQKPLISLEPSNDMKSVSDEAQDYGK